MKETTLKPCPNCGTTVDANSNTHMLHAVPSTFGYSIKCLICDVRGPSRATEEYAAQSWNEMPRREEQRPLVWSDEPPTDADYDIWLWRGSPDEMPQPYTIFWASMVTGGKATKVLMAQADLELDHMRRVSRMRGQWAGPLRMPKEE